MTNQELYESSEPFKSVYPDYDFSLLPKWVKENVETAHVYGNNKKGVILPDGRKYHLDNTLNDLTGREWTFFINSVFSTRYPTKGKESYAHEIRKIHPSPKPPQLMKEIIEFFSKENELVFDCFMGVGGTLLGASLCDREAIGVDINNIYIDAYKEANKALMLKEQETLCAESIKLLKDKKAFENLLDGRTISLMLIDPPYANMMSKEKTGGDIEKYGKEATPFSTSKYDLGNMEREDFLAALKESVELSLPYIKKRGYVILFIKDLQPSKKQLNLLHAEVIDKLNEIPELHYKGMKIWADESTKLYPYGYPFSFVANQIHQYILVFRKEK